MSMTIQQALGQLKVLKSRFDNTLAEIQKYSAWQSKKNHPLGKVGTDEYNKKEAEKAVAALIQSATDIFKRMATIKVALQQTNLTIKIKVGEREMTLAEALALKDKKTGTIPLLGALLTSIDRSVTVANSDVTRYNETNKEIADKADVWYLYNQADVEKIRKEYFEFMQQVDDAIQVANNTNNIVGLDDEVKTGE